MSGVCVGLLLCEWCVCVGEGGALVLMPLCQYLLQIQRLRSDMEEIKEKMEQHETELKVGPARTPLMVVHALWNLSSGLSLVSSS